MEDEWFRLEMPVGPNGEWTATLTWSEGDLNGPTKLELAATDPSNRPSTGISQTVLREIRIADAIKVATATRERRQEMSLPEVDWDTVGPLLRGLAAGGISDEYLAVLSQAYSAAANQPKPLERLAELVDKSAGAIKSHLWQAKRRGLLYRSPGRAGGAVTVKALKILGQLTPET